MTAHPVTAAPARRPHLASLVRIAGRKLSDRMHATADDRARALGWQVTRTRGRFGLAGRSYHDPQFDARRQARQAALAARERHHD